MTIDGIVENPTPIRHHLRRSLQQFVDSSQLPVISAPVGSRVMRIDASTAVIRNVIFQGNGLTDTTATDSTGSVGGCLMLMTTQWAYLENVMFIVRNVMHSRAHHAMP